MSASQKTFSVASGWEVVALLLIANGCVPDVPVPGTDAGTATETGLDRDEAVPEQATQSVRTGSGSDVDSMPADPPVTSPGGGQPEPDVVPGSGDEQSEPGSASTPTQAESCELEGAFRCAPGGGRSVETCVAGVWSFSAPCPDGQVCSLQEANEPTCIAVAEICMGSGGRAVCDGAGVMYACSDQGVVEGMMSCKSPRHCQAGIDRGVCAVCLPGNSDAFDCEGAELLRCTGEGDGYDSYKACESEALCNTIAGDCTDSACSPGQFVCEGDVLKRCNADQTDLVEVERCEPGLCDAETGGCDRCVPGAAECGDERTSLVCNEDGSELTSVVCPAGSEICGGAGVCVECGGDNDCEGAGACVSDECMAGVCVARPLSTGTCSGSFGGGTV